MYAFFFTGVSVQMGNLGMQPSPHSLIKGQVFSPVVKETKFITSTQALTDACEFVSYIDFLPFWNFCRIGSWERQILNFSFLAWFTIVVQIFTCEAFLFKPAD
jgi:hypothetical protein